jgi:hypothetical protein
MLVNTLTLDDAEKQVIFDAVDKIARLAREKNDYIGRLQDAGNEIARLTTENKSFRALVLETAHIHDDEINRLAGIIKNIQERNSETKYQIAFKDWKLGELHCPICGSTDLSPPNQYCTKQYVCKKCGLQFDPVKEYESVELPGLETKDAAPLPGDSLSTFERKYESVIESVIKDAAPPAVQKPCDSCTADDCQTCVTQSGYYNHYREKKPTIPANGDENE